MVMSFSIQHQQELSRKIGYDYKKWNPDDPEQVQELALLALRAQLSGMDVNGRLLSLDDMHLLSVITGRW